MVDPVEDPNPPTEEEAEEAEEDGLPEPDEEQGDDVKNDEVTDA